VQFVPEVVYFFKGIVCEW